MTQDWEQAEPVVPPEAESLAVSQGTHHVLKISYENPLKNLQHAFSFYLQQVDLFLELPVFLIFSILFCSSTFFVAGADQFSATSPTTGRRNLPRLPVRWS